MLGLGEPEHLPVDPGVLRPRPAHSHRGHPLQQRLQRTRTLQQGYGQSSASFDLPKVIPSLGLFGHLNVNFDGPVISPLIFSQAGNQSFLQAFYQAVFIQSSSQSMYQVIQRSA